MRRGKLSIFISGCAAILFAGHASAIAIYSYNGNNFDTLVGNILPIGSYTLSMSVSGSFSLASPLAPNLALQDISGSVLSYSFNDGRTTLTDINSSISDFRVATDNLGDFSEWVIELSAYPIGSAISR